MANIFEDHLAKQLQDIRSEYLVLRSGDIHRELGGYPGPNHRMPSCCAAMYKMMIAGDEVLSAPPSGKGASLTIRYYRRSK